MDCLKSLRLRHGGPYTNMELASFYSVDSLFTSSIWSFPIVLYGSLRLLTVHVNPITGKTDSRNLRNSKILSSLLHFFLTKEKEK